MKKYANAHSSARSSWGETGTARATARYVLEAGEITNELRRQGKFLLQLRCRNLLAIAGCTLGEFTGARERSDDHGIEPGIAHERCGNLERVGVVSRNG